ncbi:MAG: DUF1365 domain-containing protein, partial [Burkholderiales bacterium]
VWQECGVRPEGPIRMLAHLRYFGYSFNPVTFYYCFDASGERLEAVVAEITNTPWKERYAYALCERDNEGTGPVKRYRFGKRFHVSPFIGMNIAYDWIFKTPDQKLAVHMSNMHNGTKLFDATLDLSRTEIDGKTLSKALTAFPFMTSKVVGAIYWQAFRLWLKGTPFHPHPRNHDQKLPGPGNPIP